MAITEYRYSKEIRGLILFGAIFLSIKTIIGDTYQKEITYVLLILAWALYLLPTYKVAIEDNKIIRFKKIIKTIAVNIEDIQSITITWQWAVIIKYKGGSIYLDYFISNLKELTSTLRNLNPQIKSDDSALDGPSENSILKFLLAVIIIIVFQGAAIFFIFTRYLR